MRVQIQKWGNSLALRIPKPFAEDVGVGAGTVVDVSVSKGKLVAAPVASRRVRLDDLLRHVTRPNLDWRSRRAERAGRLPDADVNQVLAMVTALLSEGEA